MSHQRYFRYLVASAIAKLAVGIAFGIQSQIVAQTKPNTDRIPIDFPNRLAPPWENAVLSRTLESQEDINKIRFSPDGNILASVGASKVTLWQVDKGEIQRTLPGHYASKLGLEIAPTAIAFSPDSNFLATATWSQGLLSPDSSVVVWNIATGEKVLSLQDTKGCRQVLFDVEGKILYAACDLGVSAWSFPDGKKLFSLDTEYAIETIALHPQGKVMATVDANITRGRQGKQSNQIQLWQIDRGEATLLNTLDGHINEIAGLEFTADGKKLVSSSYDGKINVWNWQQGTIYPKTKNLYSDDGLFSLSADSRLIAGNFHNSTMASLVTGLSLRNVMVSAQTPQTVAFSPNGRLFARVKQSQINLWQTNSE